MRYFVLVVVFLFLLNFGNFTETYRLSKIGLWGLVKCYICDPNSIWDRDCTNKNNCAVEYCLKCTRITYPDDSIGLGCINQYEPNGVRFIICALKFSLRHLGLNIWDPDI